MENLEIISLFVRIVVGSLFFFQGYDKLFNVKVDNVVSAFSNGKLLTYLPQPLLRIVVLMSSYIEMVGGFFLIIGLFKFYILSLISIDMVIVSFVFSYYKAMWDMQFYFPRFLLICILWIIPKANDIYSLDFVFSKQ